MNVSVEKVDGMIKKKIKVNEKSFKKAMTERTVITNIRSLDIEVVTKIYKQKVHVKDGVFGMYYTYDNGINIPLYTTDISSAYTLMNYMIEKKFNFEFMSDKNKEWWALCNKKDISYTTTEKSLPLAIVKVCLMMIDYENKNSS